MTWSFCLRPRPQRMSRPNPNEHRLTDCLHVCSTCLSDPRDEFLYLESPPDSVTCTRGDATAARVCETLPSSHVKSTKIECISFSLSNDESPIARGRSPVRTARGEISHLALRLGLWCGGVGSLCQLDMPTSSQPRTRHSRNVRAREGGDRLALTPRSSVTLAS